MPLDRPVSREDRRAAREGLKRAEEILREKSADLLILDEINVAVDLQLLEMDRVRNLIEICPPAVEMVLTGRNCPAEILAVADYVSDVREITHPYRKGIAERRGIEY